MKIRALAVLVAVAVVSAVASPALAVYHPTLGRFMQRDPHGTMTVAMSARINAVGSTAAGGFRRPTHVRTQRRGQYVDGMNLYQYVGSSPTTGLDPTGLARLTYKYDLGGVVPVSARVPDANKPWGRVVDIFEWTKFIGEMDNAQRKMEEARRLLSRYGIDAQQVTPTISVLFQKQTQSGLLGSTTHELFSLDHDAEWKYLGKWSPEGGDFILFIPGLTGGQGLAKNKAAHDEDSHVIGVSWAITEGGFGITAELLAHEILHHFLTDTINPGSADPYHDVSSDRGGIMRGDEWTGTQKLGCKTVNALKRLGVTDSDIDSDIIIR